MNPEAERPEADADQATDTTATDTTAMDTTAAEGDAGEAVGDTDALAAAESKAEEHWNRYLRAAAELENVRKRAARDVENAHKFALERFAGDLLAVCDSLEMALATGGEPSVESLKAGSEATLKLLCSILQRFGIEEIDPLGAPFDPALHEAMTMQPSADAEPGSVLTVFQKGYALNGRLLRPARVVVAAGPANEAEEE